MKILAADTSTKVISVAVLDKDKIKGQIHRPYSRSQGSALIPVVKKLLEEIDYSIEEINLFCVGLGPGSFTGLRTSVCAMSSLSIALKKPIIGISSFDAIADGLISKFEFQNSKSVCVMADAKQNKVYARFYKSQKSLVEPASDFMLDEIENIIKSIDAPTLVLGNAIGIYGERLLGAKNKIELIEEKALWFPKAGILAKIAQQKHQKGYTDDPFKLLPLYIYEKECQIRRKTVYD